MAEKTEFCVCQSMKFAGETSSVETPVLRTVCETVTICSECGYGSGSNNTVSITLKMALFAPIPSARVSTAMKVKPGDLTSCRKA